MCCRRSFHSCSLWCYSSGRRRLFYVLSARCSNEEANKKTNVGETSTKRKREEGDALACLPRLPSVFRWSVVTFIFSPLSFTYTSSPPPPLYPRPFTPTTTFFLCVFHLFFSSWCVRACAGVGELSSRVCACACASVCVCRAALWRSLSVLSWSFVFVFRLPSLPPCFVHIADTHKGGRRCLRDCFLYCPRACACVCLLRHLLILSSHSLTWVLFAVSVVTVTPSAAS